MITSKAKINVFWKKFLKRLNLAFEANSSDAFLNCHFLTLANCAISYFMFKQLELTNQNYTTPTPIQPIPITWFCIGEFIGLTKPWSTHALKSGKKCNLGKPHSLHQMQTSIFYDFFNGAAHVDTTACRMTNFTEKMLILAFEVIMQCGCT